MADQDVELELGRRAGVPKLERLELALIDLNMPGMGEETAGSLAVECPETVTFLMTATPGPMRTR